MTVGGIIVKPSADSLLSNGNLVLMLNMLAALLSVCHKHNMVDKTFFQVEYECKLLLKNKNCIKTVLKN